MILFELRPKMDIPEGSEEAALHIDSWVIDSLGEITSPVLVIVGEKDKRFAASMAVFEKYLDVRSSVIVPEAGHSVHRKIRKLWHKLFRTFFLTSASAEIVLGWFRQLSPCRVTLIEVVSKRRSCGWTIRGYKDYRCLSCNFWPYGLSVSGGPRC